MEYTVRQLIAEIKDLCIQLDGEKSIPSGLTRMRKAELEHLMADLQRDLKARQDRKARRAELMAEIEEAAAEIGHTLPESKTAPLSLAELESIRTMLGEAVQAKRDREAVEAPLHVQPMAGSPAAIARAEEEAPEQLTREEMRNLWDDMGHDPLCEGRVDDEFDLMSLPIEPAVFPGDHRDGCECEDCEELDNQLDRFSEVDPEFAAEVDALLAADLREDVPATLAKRIQDAIEFPVTTTNIAESNVVVVVQSGTRLVWGKLISVVNRRTRYSAPFLCTVELESGVRQLVAADDILAA